MIVIDRYVEQVKGWWDRSPELVVGAGILAVVVAFFAWFIPAVVADQNAWETWCKENGGRITSHTSYGNTVDGKGNVGVSSSTTYYCLTPDGRILDIR